MKKEQRDSEKNNIMKSFVGVVAFGLMCWISFCEQANKEIHVNDMSWETMPQSTALQKLLY